MKDTTAKSSKKAAKIGVLERVLAFFGITISREEKSRVKIASRFFKILFIFLVFLLAGLLGLYEFSTSPLFCRSCHIMKPYYQAWEASKHNFVPCVECHYTPGTRDKFWNKFQSISQVVKYATRTYGSKPYAEIEDASCLRKGCHERRLLEGKVTFKRGIIFDHAPHLKALRRGKQLRCTSCHSQIVIGSHVEVTESTCFLCHFRGKKVGREEHPLGGCPSCHEPPKESIKVANITFSHQDFVGDRGILCQKCHLDAVEGEGLASKYRCQICHNKPEYLAKYEDVTFIHRQHVSERNIECDQCHDQIKHSVKTSVEPLDYNCNVCHTDKHSKEKLMYMGIGGKGIASIPSEMYLAQVDCVGCHIMPKNFGEYEALKGETFKASEISCFSCHGTDYEGLLNEWKSDINNSLKKIEPIIARVETLLAKVSKGERRYIPAFRLYEEAKYNYEFVKYSHGVHNYNYAIALLEKSEADLKKAIEILQLKLAENNE